VDAGYFRRWLNNFTATDDLAHRPSDYSSFSLVAPADPRLPGSGNYPINGLYNISQAGFGIAAQQNITNSNNFGGGQTQIYNGMLVNISARPRNGLTLQGGINSGKTVIDYCAVRSAIPGLSVGAAVGTTNPYCHVDPGFITKMSGIATWIIPRIDVLIAGTVRSDQGAPLRATWNAPVATVSAALGRPAAVAGVTVPIDLIAPGQVWGDRVNEFDIKVAKVLRFGRTRTNVGIDIYNLTNSAAILQYNQTFNPAVAAGAGAGAWLAPQALLTPRFVKISAQIDF
jgi:hypothetical protein